MENYLKNRLMALGLITVLSVNNYGCSKDKVSEKNAISYNDTIYIEDNKVDNNYLEEYKKNYSTDIKFKRDEFYNNNHLFEKQDNNCSFVYAGDVKDICEHIINNSNSNETEELKSIFKDVFIGNDMENYLHTIISEIIDTCSRDDLHNLYNLKIMEGVNNFGDYSAIGSYSSNSQAIIIDVKYLKNYYWNTFYTEVANNLLLNYLYSMLVTQINVARQYNCSDGDFNTGICDDGRSNTLSISIASSNYYVNDYLNDRAIILSNEYSGDEMELVFLGILNNDKDAVDKYYKSFFNQDYDTLFEVLDLKNQKDIDNFKKIVKAIDAKNHRNSYAKRYGISENNLPDEVGYEYKILIYNMFVNNMIDKMKNDDISLEENLVLYNTVLNTLVDDQYNNFGYNNVTFDKDFVNKLYELDEKYTDLLCKYYNVSYEELRYNYKLNTSAICNDMYVFFNNDDARIGIDLDPDFKQVREIAEKYPLLKIIYKSEYINTYNFQNLLEDNNLSLKI